jgi:hypothetical protein
MREFLSTVSALAVTNAIFSVVSAKQLVRRQFGLKSLRSSHINDIQHSDTFHIPDDIQRRFRRLMFWRTMMKDPYLWQEDAQKVHEDMVSHIKQMGWKPPAPAKIDRLDWNDILADKNQFYQDYIAKQKPCIIKNTPYDKKLWTTEYIKKIWGDNPMIVHDIADQGKSHEMTLNQMIDFNAKGLGCAYMSFNRTFFDTNKTLLKDTLCAEQFSEILKKRRKADGALNIEAQLFVSTESTHPTHSLARTFMHCANNINMFFNVEGKKRWVLVDPEFSLCVYPSTFFRNTAAFFSLIKSATPAEKELPRFPLYEYCPKYQVDLEEGDVLFIPCWWWHSVETLTPATLSIAIRFGLTAFGSLFPGDMADPNALFTTLQVLYPGFKKELFDVVRTKIRAKLTKYDGTQLRSIDVRQEVEKDYDTKYTIQSEKTVRMWRKVPEAS